MPVFEYRCGGCGARFEKLSFSPNPSVACPGCGSREVEKMPSTFGMSGVEHRTTSSTACASCHSGSCASCGR